MSSPRADRSFLRLSDSVLFQIHEDHVIFLNLADGRIWEVCLFGAFAALHCDGRKAESEVAEIVKKVFKARGVTFNKNLATYLSHLRALGILQLENTKVKGPARPLEFNRKKLVGKFSKFEKPRQVYSKDVLVSAGCGGCAGSSGGGSTACGS